MDKIPYHVHDGIDSPKTKPQDQEGFPIYNAIPTHKASEGQIVLVLLPGAPDTYFLYAMINKVWRGTQLTL